MTKTQISNINVIAKLLSEWTPFDQIAAMEMIGNAANKLRETRVSKLAAAAEEKAEKIRHANT